jgi:hypothetical protein
VREVKKGEFMKKILLSLIAVFAVILAIPAIAWAHHSPPPSPAYPFTLKPFEFVGTDAQCGPGTAGDPDKVTAEWVKSTGNPKPSVKLQKLGLTTSCLAAGVDIITSLEGQAVSNLTELNFDFKDTWHCGAGAPRFNLQIDASGNQNGFLGCNSVLGTKTPLGNGWTHMEFSATDIATAVVTAGGNPSSTLHDLYMIFDEGSDTGPDFTGTAFVDNFSVNNQTVGSPTVPRSKNDCRNNGWQNLTDKQGNAFTSESDCKDFVNNNKDRGHRRHDDHKHHHKWWHHRR